MERFPRLTQEQMSPAQREVAAEISAGPRGEVRRNTSALAMKSRVSALAWRRRRARSGESVAGSVTRSPPFASSATSPPPASASSVAKKRCAVSA